MDLFSVHTGEIEGALYTVATPTTPWSGSVLLHCHGCRPVGIPLVADLNLQDLLYRNLLNQGWIVGMTSYRREGLIIRDAIQDVINLRKWIEMKYGKPSLVILEGESMGGCIVTLMSERYGEELFSGVLAIGAALLAREKESPLEFLKQPKIPLLYLTNYEEIHPVNDYARQCSNEDFKPATWVVLRNGHCNVNYEERTKALQALLKWIAEGTIEREVNATHVFPPQKSQVYFDADGGWGIITATDAWGDITTNLQPTDLQKLGIHHGTTFTLELGGKRFHQKGREFKARYGGNSFLSTNQGEWYCYDHANGFIVISANGYARDHLVTRLAEVDVGDVVHVLKPVGVGAALLGIPGGVDQKRKMFVTANSST